MPVQTPIKIKSLFWKPVTFTDTVQETAFPSANNHHKIALQPPALDLFEEFLFTRYWL